MKALFWRGIEHFEQGGGGIAAEIGADLVDFVEQDDRVAGFDAAQGLNDAAGQGADIGAAVAADFRLVPHAAEGDAGEFPAEGVGDAFAEGGFADAGRADQAEDGAFELLLELDDGQELQQAVLDFAQAEMLLVQQRGGAGQVQFVLGEFGPGQIDEPVQVIAGHGVFGDGRGHLLEAVQFLEGDFSGFIGQVVLLDLLAQFLGFGGAGVHLAQFALDGADLLAEEEIALIFGHGGDDLVLDFGSELEDFQFAAEQGEEAGEADLGLGQFQQMLALLAG